MFRVIIALFTLSFLLYGASIDSQIRKKNRELSSNKKKYNRMDSKLSSVAKKITQEDWCEEYIYGCVMAIDPKSCLWNGEKALQDAQECIQSRMENDMFPDWKWWKTPIDKFTEDIEDTDCFDSKLQWQIWASKNGAKYFGNMGIDFGNEIPYLVTVVKEALYKISKGGN
jgi:hypothetical protein